jgi:hypothetical protein
MGALTRNQYLSFKPHVMLTTMGAKAKVVESNLENWAYVGKT